MSGARAALEYFHVPDVDAASRSTPTGRQRMNHRLIEAATSPLPDALRFAIAVKDSGLLVAAASSSKNAKPVLERVRLDRSRRRSGSRRLRQPGLTLLDFFDANVNGRDFKHGKPHPEMFLTAAGELGVRPERAVVLEDAVAGVQAAKAGEMGAIGVARAETQSCSETRGRRCGHDAGRPRSGRARRRAVGAESLKPEAHDFGSGAPSGPAFVEEWIAFVSARISFEG